MGADTPVRPVGTGRPQSRFEIELGALRRHDTETEATRSFGPSTPFATGANLMGIFSRTRDIIAANFNDLLDKADDPAKMIRMIIMEMEETLVEVRASAARTIADQKEMARHVAKLDRLQADWADKAQLALSKGREDLARAALVEKKRAVYIGSLLLVPCAGVDPSVAGGVPNHERPAIRAIWSIRENAYMGIIA